MEFRLLGPVEVVVNGKPVPLGGRQRRTLLSILLVYAGQSVSTERLIDELWGDVPPDAARKTVQAHIAHLRRTLNLNGEVISAAENGYVVRVDPDSIDVKRFERLVEEGRSLRADYPDRSARTFEEALGLFRGAALSGVADDAFSLRTEASRLEELRLAAMEDQLDAQLAVGATATVITQANRLVAQHPLRERLWALLMLALYRAGRQGEALRAFARVRQVLVEELGIEPSSELQTLEQRILDQDPTLTEPIPVPVASTVITTPSVRNPYKGLRAFDEADAADFFGRDDLVRRMMERLTARDRRPLVVLAGPSGAGKSSAVCAGLVPELRQLGREVAVMFPGAEPLAALAKAVAEVSTESPEDVLVRLEKGEAPIGDPILVVVDQFEELFTMSAPDEADRFLTLLAEANASIEWVVTVRSDFIDRILINPRLGGLLEEVLLLVPPLLDHEVSSAVTGPARRVGVEVEANLVAEVIRDVRARPSALPLLQYALTDTFERRRGPTLALADYQDAGGISGALSRRADELYETMDPSRKEAARQLLLALVAVTEDGEEVRRRVDREALMSLPAGGAQISWVIERLGTERLLTFDQSPETGRATVEVAHEALISEWPRLARWVENSRDDLRLRQRISAAAQEWVESGRDSGFLLTGSRLDQFSGWASATDLELTALESDYLRSSRQASQDRQRRASRTRTLIVAGVAVGVVAATGLGVLALSQRQATEEQTRIVQAANLAAAANDSLEIDPERSILLAVEAVETTRRVDGTVLGVAEEALHRAVLAHRLLGRVTHNGTGIAHFSPDGRTFVTSAEDATTAQVWSVTPFEPALTLTGHTDLVIDAVFDPAGDRIATGSLDGSVRVWNATNGELQITFEVGGAPPLIPVFSNDGSMLAATSLDGTTRVWDLDTQDLVWALSPPPGTINTLNLEFSPDDTLLAVTRSTEPAAEQIGPLIYDLTTGELVRTLEGHLSGATDIGFTPDGTRIVTSAHDLTLRVWEVETGEHTGTYFGHVGPVQDLQISADGSTVASSGRVDVQVWDLETFETKATIVGHGGLVDGIDLSPGGDLLLTASDTDKTARLWDLTTYWSHELVGLPGPTKDLLAGTAYSPDGEILAASRGTGQVTLWNPITGREIESFEGPGIHQNLAFDPTGSILAAAGSAGVTLHDIQSHEDIASLVEGVFTNDVAFSSQGLLAAATLTGVHLLEPPYTGDGEVISTLQTNSVAFDPRGEIIALSLQDGFFRYFIEIRAVDGGELLAELTEHDQGVYGLAFDPAGEVLATASDDTTVILWDTNTFEPIHRLEGHTAELFDVAFDPTRPEIATASGDGTIKIWDLHTGKLRLTLPGSGSEVAYSPDGRYLAAAGPEGFVTVYMLDIDELIAEAQSRLTRWWTDGECFQYLRTDECPPTGE